MKSQFIVQQCGYISTCVYLNYISNSISYCSVLNSQMGVLNVCGWWPGIPTSNDDCVSVNFMGLL